jgi:hypothetical protein
LGLLTCEEETLRRYGGGKDETVWRYRLHENFDQGTLLSMVQRPGCADFG